MAAPKFKKNRVEQEIDLKEIFGIDFRNRPALREAIGEAILRKIRERTDNNEGIRFDSRGRGRKFNLNSVPYSEEYKNSIEFRAFGKREGDVDMRLTGDMLGLMDIKKQTGNSITIGWSDSEQNAKAFNHSVGDTVPARPFFGCSKSELEEIARDFRSDIRRAVRLQEEEGRSAFNEFATGLIDRIRGGVDGEG